MSDKQVIALPPPVSQGPVSLEETLMRRRTVRSFAPLPVPLHEVSQILWATYGAIDARPGRRTAPSAGALYPLDCYLAAGEGGGGEIEAGVYHYLPADHALEPHVPGDRRQAIARASLSQQWMAQAPIMVVITAEHERTTGKYRERGIRYVHMEAGHAAENLLLQAVALGLGAAIVGAFDDKAVAEQLALPLGHVPLLIVPIGHAR
jgi:SagB-type dehydrogenase family enzyme